ncbi:MAG: hypothetical protein K1X83_11025 [Oligoflexia bacterium]|nr:hypothetical protein [Oligoflexia bacterium]
MKTKLDVLVFEDSVSNTEGLKQALESHYELRSFDTAANVPDLLQLHIENHYDMCLVYDTWPNETVEMFYKDYLKLERNTKCVFAQIKNQVPEKFDRTSLRHLGFTTVVSTAINAHDLTALRLAFREKRQITVEERIDNVEQAVKLLIKDVDRIASDRKRGRDKSLQGVSAQFISGQTQVDPAVLEAYFDKLAQETESAAPTEHTEIVVPEEVVEKELPGLSKDGYAGASNRVWKKLVKAFGRKGESEERAAELPPESDPPTKPE